MTDCKRKQKAFTHWSEQLNLEYHFFLLLNYQDFIYGSKKSNKLYKEMGKFLVDKTSTQCRTHHQKKIKGLPREVDVLYHFYHDYYQVRYLQIEHLTVQIKKLLKTKINKQIIQSSEAKNLEDQLQNTLRLLDFKNHCLEQGTLVGIVEKVETKNQEVQFCYQEIDNNDISHFFNQDSQVQRLGSSYDESRILSRYQ